MDNQQYQQPQYNNNAPIIIGNQKSPMTAALLGFFFGPIGLCYATVSGGAIMFIVYILGAFLIIIGIGIIILCLVHPICAIWGYNVVENENKAQMMGNMVNIANRNNPPPPQIQSSSIQQQIQAPITPLLEAPKPSIIIEEPVSYSQPVGNTSKNDVYADIEQLAKLKEMDILTQDEFDAQKSILLNKLQNL
jgi:hypothetical protein